MATANNLSLVLRVEHLDGRFDIGGKWRWVFGAAFSGQFVWGRSLNPKDLAPILDAKSHPVNGDILNGSRIKGLLPRGCPPAVSGLVMAIIVNSIYRVPLRGLFPHIFVEGFKTIKPSVANANSSPSISGVLVVFRVMASLLHDCPRLIFKRLTHVMSALVGVATQQVGRCLLGQASTAKGAFAYVGSRSDGHCSTVTLAVPHSVPAALWTRGATDNKQPAELFPSNINGFWHVALTKRVVDYWEHRG